MLEDGNASENTDQKDDEHVEDIKITEKDSIRLSNAIQAHKGLTLIGSALAIISTTIGGGIIGLPWAFY